MTGVMAINWLGALSGTFIAFLIGYGWYHPKVFGDKWATGSNLVITDDMPFPVFAMFSQFTGLLLMAILIAVVVAWDSMAMVALILVMVFVQTISMGAFSQKDWYARLVDGGYQVVSGLIMLLVLTVY